MAIEDRLKVRQLIEELKKFDQELEVVVDGYEGGADSLYKSNIATKYIDKDNGSDWCGEHGDLEDTPDSMTSPHLVILLSRGGDIDE
jgi:hypothetical protein